MTLVEPSGSAAPPFLGVLKTLAGSWISQSLYVVAKFDIADRLAHGPMGIEELAQDSGLNADALYRFLRAAAMADVVTEVEPRRFALTPQGQFLRADVPGSQKWSAIMFGEETFHSWAGVLHTARTGRPAFDAVFGRPYFEYIADHPEAKRVFNAAMQTSGDAPLAAAYDFSGVRRVIDVGGGRGALLRGVLRAQPGVDGVLFDLPDVVSSAELADVADRCEVVPGSFFEPDAIPRGGDLLILSRVLHDWDDDDALRILANVKAAMRPGARLVVLERLIPPGDGFHPGKLFDLAMLVVLGGRDRTQDEYSDLLTRSGLTVARTLPLPGGMSAMEAIA